MRPMLPPRLLRKMLPPPSRLLTLPLRRPPALRTLPARPRARPARRCRRPREHRPAATRRTRRSIVRSRSRWVSKPTVDFAKSEKGRRGAHRGVFFLLPAGGTGAARRGRKRRGHARRLTEGPFGGGPIRV